MVQEKSGGKSTFWDGQERRKIGRRKKGRKSGKDRGQGRTTKRSSERGN